VLCSSPGGDDDPRLVFSLPMACRVGPVQVRRRFIWTAILVAALASALVIGVYEYVLEEPDGARVEATAGEDSAFCKGFLQMTPDLRLGLLRAKATEFLYGIQDGSGLDACLPDYVAERAAAVERKCRSRGDFDAGSTLGQILAVGLRDCRNRADSRD